MTKSILALDLALDTGYACWKVGDLKPRAGLLEIPRTEAVGPRLASLYKWALAKAREWEINDICVETPITAQMPGTAAKAIWLISAYGVMDMLAAQLKINMVPIANVTMAIHWMGTRDIEKKDRKAYSVVEAQRRGFSNITDHNTADALGLLSLRCCQLALQTPWDSKRSPGPLFTGVHPAGIKIGKANQVAANIALNKTLSFNAGEKK